MAVVTAAAPRMNLRPINRRALRRYGEFWRALTLLGTALGEAEKLAAQAVDVEPRLGAGGNWAAPTAEEMRTAAKKGRPVAAGDVPVRSEVGARAGVPGMEALTECHAT